MRSLSAIAILTFATFGSVTREKSTSQTSATVPARFEQALATQDERHER